MKKISVLIPCYNEVGNIEAMANAVTEQLKKFPQYDYEIIFRDNSSKDGSLEVLRRIASKDKHIKVIINTRNYGLDFYKDSFKNHVSGDVVIHIPCDFQEPPELIPEFIRWWEKGYEVVAGQKTSSEEGKIKYGLRRIFYNIISAFSDVPQYNHLSGILLFSKRIYEMRFQYAPTSVFRYFLADLGCAVKLIPYRQRKRKSGKSSYNIWRSLSFAIDSLIATSTLPLRIATVLGCICSFVSFLCGIVYFILKLIFWDSFIAGTAPLMIGLFFIGGIQILFIGLVGEYVGSVLKKVSPHVPPAFSEMINFDRDDEFLIPPPYDSENSK